MNRTDSNPSPVRTLAVVFGDQLDRSYPDHLGLDQATDAVLMLEVAGESRHVPSHFQRTTLFLSAMRHHAAWLRDQGWRVAYVRLDDRKNTQEFGSEIVRACERLAPERLTAVRPGEHRVLAILKETADGSGIKLTVKEDPHFLCDPGTFNAWAEGRKELVMEHFYREQRRSLGLLVDNKGNPEGGQWNFDKDNRKSFRASPRPPKRPAFTVDAITREVMDTVRRTLPDLPGSLDNFNWPVTREQALKALDHFIKSCLPRFGDYQDAMWLGQRTLYHALLSPVMNLKLLNPREIVDRAVRAYEDGSAPLNAVEGFVRQIIGWREFIRGVYWLEGPDYAGRNGLKHKGRLPGFYWDAETDMACMADAISGVLETAYAHHISRLMVTGNFALIAGIDPKAVSDWYLGMYADGVDWVTLPNTLGMALHADGGVVGTKPYAASGKYIQRMSNACEHCRYDVTKRTGEDACPFNVFYWDFLIRHEKRFSSNRRMRMMLKNLERMSEQETTEITVSAGRLRRDMGIDPA
ncbi:MAG: cryptochrome/photolyase family protein [Phycisphaerales bacterium]|nr:cryptochrome/photolyase family protein [Planctomycetota bacterium]MCH8507628.1 cryptochrome/photolyase family protein [Phycisphaerales bacterium]